MLIIDIHQCHTNIKNQSISIYNWSDYLIYLI